MALLHIIVNTQHVPFTVFDIVSMFIHYSRMLSQTKTPFARLRAETSATKKPHKSSIFLLETIFPLFSLLLSNLNKKILPKMQCQKF